MVEAFPELETKRLVLREMQPDDAEAYFRVLSDAEVMQYYDGLPFTTLEQSYQSIARHHRRFEQEEGIRWGITLKGENIVIGNCGFAWDTQHRSAVLVYVLSRSYWRQGIMAEALQAILTFGFDTKHVHRVEAEVVVNNGASIHILQKFGFQEEGVLRERFFVNEHFYDEKIFSLLEEEFRQQ
ncbi:MAG TPA: GNAT family N-acetyltransferase [Ktedonobacter sp.]|nr:GNAT family N-acetyltransferase [Ktedonobacter sp.]